VDATTSPSSSTQRQIRTDMLVASALRQLRLPIGRIGCCRRRACDDVQLADKFLRLSRASDVVASTRTHALRGACGAAKTRPSRLRAPLNTHEPDSRQHPTG